VLSAPGEGILTEEVALEPSGKGKGSGRSRGRRGRGRGGAGEGQARAGGGEISLKVDAPARASHWAQEGLVRTEKAALRS